MKNIFKWLNPFYIYKRLWWQHMRSTVKDLQLEKYLLEIRKAAYHQEWLEEKQEAQNKETQRLVNGILLEIFGKCAVDFSEDTKDPSVHQ